VGRAVGRGNEGGRAGGVRGIGGGREGGEGGGVRGVQF
jgi:hypothetical protein